MRVTLDDVARRSGVSVATASRALRAVPNVAPATREKVLSAARELGYRPVAVGPSPHGGRPGVVGVVVPHVDRWYFGRVISHIGAVLREEGIDVLIHDLGDESGRVRFFADLPVHRQVDALLVLGVGLDAQESAVLRATGLPVVVVGSPDAEVADAPQVRVDDTAGALKAMRHLVNLGHRDIGLISAARSAPLGLRVPAQQRHAYLSTLREVGVTPEADLDVGGDFSVAGGERAMDRLLAAGRRPTAVFAASDEMAFGALIALRNAGLRVPEDLSVIGFDNHEMAEVFGLTTIAQPVREQGALAARMLLGLLDRGPVPVVPAVLSAHLVIRGSTAPCGGADGRPRPTGGLPARWR